MSRKHLGFFQRPGVWPWPLTMRPENQKGTSLL